MCVLWVPFGFSVGLSAIFWVYNSLYLWVEDQVKSFFIPFKAKQVEWGSLTFFTQTFPPSKSVFSSVTQTAWFLMFSEMLSHVPFYEYNLYCKHKTEIMTL